MMDRPGIDLRRVVLLTLSGLLVVLAATEFKAGLDSRGWADYAGNDYRIYMQAVGRWMAGDGFYLPRQLTGPYAIQVGDVLYPPTAIWFMLPFAFLPAAFWWALPAALLGYLLASWHPAMWSWPLLVACLAWPTALTLVVAGNPSMWIAAFVGAGLRFGWPGALVLLKPSLFPFGLAGVTKRGWWVAAATLAVITLPLASLIPDWLRAVFDGRGFEGPLYSVHDVPLVSFPVIAWAARSRKDQPDTAHPREDPCSKAHSVRS